MVLSDKSKELAIKYVEATGFYKNRLAKFLGISRPTLDNIFDNDLEFFTQIELADSIFCKGVIERVRDKNPSFILKTKYREEFNENAVIFDPISELKKISDLINSMAEPDESLENLRTGTVV